MADNEFDILVLGGGSAGYAAALRGVQLGFSVALIEKSKLGGTCLHWGCIPTKAYLHSAELATEAQNSEKYGVSIGDVSVDMAKVREYKDSIVAGKFKGLQAAVRRPRTLSLSTLSCGGRGAPSRPRSVADWQWLRRW